MQRTHKIVGLATKLEGVHPDPEKTKAIQAIHAPQSSQECLLLLVDMAPFIPNLSPLSEPLRKLLKKDTDFYWSPSHS